MGGVCGDAKHDVDVDVYKRVVILDATRQVNAKRCEETRVKV